MTNENRVLSVLTNERRVLPVSGQEEAVEDCDMMEDEAEGGVRGNCFPVMR